MKKVLVTGSGGLVGSETVDFFAKKNFKVFGIDNDMRSYFFGNEASTRPVQDALQVRHTNYAPFNIDIRDAVALDALFREHSFDLIVHTAAQPSHDWAASEPTTDFTINANGTLNLLEATRKYAPDAVFIFTSTNKVYGDTPNYLPLVELDTRYEIEEGHQYSNGIGELMSVDNTLHSLFGVSKTAADLLVQEYGKYFGLKTGVFRGGCLTGSRHKAAPLHGFLGYLVKCVLEGREYSILGYQGKQVRDNIHSYDLVNAFYHFYQNPRAGEVYNMGGSRHSHCSVREALALAEDISGKKAQYRYVDAPRKGDHIWYISDVSKFKSHYPLWQYTYDVPAIIKDMVSESYSL